MSEKIVKDYLLEWKMNSNEGKIIFIFEDDSDEKLDGLEVKEFTAMTAVLEKGETMFDDDEKTLYNVMP
ncbi:hypothetical protein B0A69_17330 [Chryseobacterium shigense]|uniref:Uncharacterized protein n=1 Tax=Chryseobacterium shigense TaxID=297244 RepID=A0A1N7IDL9_9FLAO|nr:hypothetical protein [Chryseobacterium shigense]PQA91566.1 hypothetical protein B0A69_17330 [Chryseobacterium shigense]SIS35111.1 hypothetical protein SAMN05421639_103180 [Chryseobacterium shigense]